MGSTHKVITVTKNAPDGVDVDHRCEDCAFRWHYIAGSTPDEHRLLYYNAGDESIHHNLSGPSPSRMLLGQPTATRVLGQCQASVRLESEPVVMGEDIPGHMPPTTLERDHPELAQHIFSWVDYCWKYPNKFWEWMSRML